MPLPALAPHASVRAMYLLIFLFVGGYGNFFPLWLDSIGLSEAEVGWLAGLKTASLLVWPIVWGVLADRWNSSIRALRVICVGSMITFLPFLSVRTFVPLLLTLLFFSAFRMGVIATTDALTLTHVQHHPSEDYGRIRSWGSAGFIVGGFLLALLVHLIGRVAVPPVLAALLFLTAVVAICSAATSTPSRGSQLADAARTLQRSSIVRRLLFVSFVNRLAVQGLYIFLPLHLQDLGVTDALIPAYWSIGVLSEIVLLRLAPQLFGARTPRTMLCFCFAVCVLQYALTAMITNPWVLLPVMLLHGVTFGVWYYTTVMWLGHEVEAPIRTTAQALFQSVGFGIGGSISAIGAGYLFQAGRGGMLFTAAAALSALTLGIAWFLLPSGGRVDGHSRAN